MNRYIIQGLEADLHGGKTVGLMAVTRAHAAAVFKNLLAELGDAPNRVCRAHGREELSMPNGGHLVVLAASGSAIRRHAYLDVLLALDWHHQSMETVEEILLELEVCSQTGKQTEVIQN